MPPKMLLSVPVLVTEKENRSWIYNAVDLLLYTSTYLHIFAWLHQLFLATASHTLVLTLPLLAAKQLQSGRAEIWGQWPGDEPVCRTFRPLLLHARQILYKSAWLPHSRNSVDNPPVSDTFTSSASALDAVVSLIKNTCVNECMYEREF